MKKENKLIEILRERLSQYARSIKTYEEVEIPRILREFVRRKELLQNLVEIYSLAQTTTPHETFECFAEAVENFLPGSKVAFLCEGITWESGEFKDGGTIESFTSRGYEPYPLPSHPQCYLFLKIPEGCETLAEEIGEVLAAFFSAVKESCEKKREAEKSVALMNFTLLTFKNRDPLEKVLKWLEEELPYVLPVREVKVEEEKTGSENDDFLIEGDRFVRKMSVGTKEFVFSGRFSSESPSTEEILAVRNFASSLKFYLTGRVWEMEQEEQVALQETVLALYDASKSTDYLTEMKTFLPLLVDSFEYSGIALVKVKEDFTVEYLMKHPDEYHIPSDFFLTYYPVVDELTLEDLYIYPVKNVEGEIDHYLVLKIESPAERATQNQLIANGINTIFQIKEYEKRLEERLDEIQKLYYIKETFKESEGVEVDSLLKSLAEKLQLKECRISEEEEKNGVPLSKGDVFFGHLVVRSRGNEKLKESVLTSLAEELSDYLYTLHVKNKAERDGLTGLYNKETLNAILTSRFNLAKADPSYHLTVVIADIDHFKRINDTYGHLIGDEALKAFAQTLRDTLRKEDVVGRWGGEEFMIILNGDLEAGKVAAEKVRKAVEKIKLNTSKGPLTFTASLGVAEASDEDRSPQDLVARADECLYVAKKSGRNRVVAI